MVGASVRAVYVCQRTPLGDHAPEYLVRHGLYGGVRNPMTLGMLTVLVGEAIAFNKRHLLSLAGVVAVLSIVAAETVERRELEKKFGVDYRVYRSTTPGWLPRRKFGPVGRERKCCDTD